jgi:hypothetical protein
MADQSEQMSLDEAQAAPPNQPLRETSERSDTGQRLISVAVLGSCISRDNFNSRFNPEYKQAYECVLMQNQSSLISLMSKGFELSDEQLGDGNDYDRWNVTTDLSKEFLDRIGELAPDYLILDFFGDVHFGCLDLGDGRYITNNRWKLWPTPYYRELEAAGPPRSLRLDQDTDEYLRLWRDAYDRLVQHLQRVAPDTTVVVHRGHNTDLLALPDADAPVSLSGSGRLQRLDVPLLNRLWAQLDDYAVSSTGFDQIDLTGKDYPTSPEHPWGPYYVHYSMDYYADFLAALSTLHLRHLLSRPENRPGDVVLDQLLAHLRQRSDEAVQRKDGTIRRLRARLRRQDERLRRLQDQPSAGTGTTGTGTTTTTGAVRRVAGTVLGPRVTGWVRPVARRLTGR